MTVTSHTREPARRASPATADPPIGCRSQGCLFNTNTEPYSICLHPRHPKTHTGKQNPAPFAAEAETVSGLVAFASSRGTGHSMKLSCVRTTLFLICSTPLPSCRSLCQSQAREGPKRVLQAMRKPRAKQRARSHQLQAQAASVSL